MKAKPKVKPMVEELIEEEKMQTESKADGEKERGGAAAVVVNATGDVPPAAMPKVRITLNALHLLVFTQTRPVFT
jgi:hypothetical protein